MVARDPGTWSIVISNREQSSARTVTFAWLQGEDSDASTKAALGAPTPTTQHQHHEARSSLRHPPSPATPADAQPLADSAARLHSKLDAIIAQLAYQDVRYTRNHESKPAMPLLLLLYYTQSLSLTRPLPLAYSTTKHSTSCGVDDVTRELCGARGCGVPDSLVAPPCRPKPRMGVVNV